MQVIAIDPGYRQSARLIYDGTAIVGHAKADNQDTLDWLIEHRSDDAVLVIEEMQLFSSHGGVGREIFDSVRWSGRFQQAWQPHRVDLMLRGKVRAHLRCSKGGDPAVRQALIERFGPYKEDAIGKKASPGPLYGLTADRWSALAIAVVWWDLNGPPPEALGAPQRPDTMPVEPPAATRDAKSPWRI